MRQETYKRQKESAGYENPPWMPFLAVGIALVLVWGGRFLAEYSIKPLLPKESLVLSRLQSQEGQSLWSLVDEEETYSLLLAFLSGEIQAAFDEGYIPTPEDARLFVVCAQQAQDCSVTVKKVVMEEDAILLTAQTPSEEEADAFLLGLRGEDLEVSYESTDFGEVFSFVLAIQR